MTVINPATRGEWRRLCPYGRWTCEGGREVLFNRSYCPIFERSHGGPARLAQSTEWIRNITRQEWFFDDGDTPWHYNTGRWKKSQMRINAVLREWGQPELGKVPPRSTDEVTFHMVRASAVAIAARPNPWKKYLRVE